MAGHEDLQAGARACGLLDVGAGREEVARWSGDRGVEGIRADGCDALSRRLFDWGDAPTLAIVVLQARTDRRLAEGRAGSPDSREVH